MYSQLQNKCTRMKYGHHAEFTSNRMNSNGTMPLFCAATDTSLYVIPEAITHNSADSAYIRSRNIRPSNTTASPAARSNNIVDTFRNPVTMSIAGANAR